MCGTEPAHSRDALSRGEAESKAGRRDTETCISAEYRKKSHLSLSEKVRHISDLTNPEDISSLCDYERTLHRPRSLRNPERG